MRSAILLLFLFIVTYCQGSCVTRMDCGQCHYCDVLTHTCMPVPPLEDPYRDCPSVCDTPMVCNHYQHCVLKSKPHCDCDYSNGNCIAKTTPPQEMVSLTLPPPPPPPVRPVEAVELLEMTVLFTIINIFCAVFIIIVMIFKFPASLHPKTC